jgi:hypothetical protein
VTVLLWFGRIALIGGVILIISASMIDHPPIYLGGAVEYPGQAVTIVKRKCGSAQPDLLKDPSLPWQEWLSYDDMKSAYVWYAGFFLPHDGECMVSINPRTGRVVETRMGAE